METIIKSLAIGAVVFLLLTLASMFVMNLNDITRLSEFARFIIVLGTGTAMAIIFLFDMIDKGKL